MKNIYLAKILKKLNRSAVVTCSISMEGEMQLCLKNAILGLEIAMAGGGNEI